MYKAATNSCSCSEYDISSGELIPGELLLSKVHFCMRLVWENKETEIKVKNIVKKVVLIYLFFLLKLYWRSTDGNNSVYNPVPIGSTATIPELDVVP